MNAFDPVGHAFPPQGRKRARPPESARTPNTGMVAQRNGYSARHARAERGATRARTLGVLTYPHMLLAATAVAFSPPATACVTP